MTLTLTPETEAQLTVVAAQRGLSPEDTLAALLAEARADIEQERHEIREGLRQSEADFAAGRSFSLDELVARLDAQRQAFQKAAWGAGSVDRMAPGR